MASIPELTCFLAAVHRWQDGHGQPGGRAEAAAQGRRANCWTTELDLGSRRCSRHRRGPFPRQRGCPRFFRQRDFDGALLAAAVHRSTARKSLNYMVEPRSTELTAVAVRYYLQNSYLSPISQGNHSLRSAIDRLSPLH